MAVAVRKAFQNFGFLAAAQLAARILHFALLAVIARFLGKAALGGYSTAISVAFYLLMIVDLGISPRLAREGAARPADAQEEFARSLGAKIALLPPSIVVIFLCVRFLPYPRDVLELLAVFAAGSVLQSFCQLTEALLRAREKMHWEALGTLSQGVITVGVSIAALSAGWSILWVGWARLLGLFARFIIALRPSAREIRLRISLVDPSPTIRKSLPYAASAITAIAFGQIDVVILSFISTQSLIGEYTSVSRLLLALGAFAIVGSNALLPAASRAFTTSGPRTFRGAMSDTLRIAAIGGAAGTVIFGVAGGPLLRLVFGPGFGHLDNAMAIGSLFVLLKTVTSVFGMGLTACDRQAARARAIGWGVVVTFVLVVGLTPILGMMGPVIALVGSEWFLAALLLLAGRDVLVDERSGSLFVALPLALAACGASWWALRAAGWPLAACVVGLGAFGLSILALGEVAKTRDSLRRLLSFRREAA